jgi:hypothetical protein
MPDVAHGVRGQKPPTPSSDDDPYALLVQTILHCAIEDAQGHCVSPGQTPP